MHFNSDKIREYVLGTGCREVSDTVQSYFTAEKYTEQLEAFLFEQWTNEWRSENRCDKKLDYILENIHKKIL